MKHLVWTILGFSIVLAGCKPKDLIDYDVPATYNFANVNYSGQTARLDMVAEMTTYMKTANVTGMTLDAQRLKDMYENRNNPFSFTTVKQLKDKCFLADQDLFEAWFDSITLASGSTVTGSNGVAGVVESNDGSKKYLLAANGFEYTQLIEKGLMGAIFYYQATGVYLSDAKIGPTVDNKSITPGEGTPMQHHWDEAFGYFGVPTDFPGNKSGIRFFGKYCNDRDAILKCNKVLMDAFILGRAAILNDDHDTKDVQVKVIRDTWERVVAATAIHYLNDAKSHMADDALRNHELSEAIAFTRALKYNPTKKISDAQIQTVMDGIGNNLYTVTLGGLDGARTVLSSAYGLDSVKDQL